MWLLLREKKTRIELMNAVVVVFIPLVVESLGLCSMASCPVLQGTLRTATRSGISHGLVYHKSARATLCFSVVPQRSDLLACCLAVLYGIFILTLSAV